MGYIYMIIMTLAFSFVGVFIKSAQLMVNAAVISFARFFVGTFFLLLIILLSKRSPKLKFNSKYIWIGAIAKSINYICENYGVTRGYSYGNIIVWPVQSIVVLIFSIAILKEKLSRRSLIGVITCILGIGIISWNGVPFSEFIGKNLLLSILFVIAGTGAATFNISQKMLIDDMDSADMNLSMFIISSIITAIPIPFSTGIYTGFSWLSVLGITMLGLITGIGFLLIAAAMKTVPLFLITIIQSSTVIFTLLWSVLIFNETVTNYMKIGTMIFVIGMILINLKAKQKASENIEQ